MKLFLVLLFFAAAYLAVLFSITDTVMGQAQNLNQTYQYVANHSDAIATGEPAGASAN
ncbi:MAG TPA: hypothetical protein VHB72_00070 [Candidatus Saccharimonadales bacterium]|nr:hypothetical protein [Candidatus Saccharimonadales bacterium]